MIDGIGDGGSRTGDSDLADTFHANRAHVFVYFVYPVRLQRPDKRDGSLTALRNETYTCAMMPIGRLRDGRCVGYGLMGA